MEISFSDVHHTNTEHSIPETQWDSQCTQDPGRSPLQERDSTDQGKEIVKTFIHKGAGTLTGTEADS